MDQVKNINSKIKKELNKIIDEEGEIGLQVAVYLNGKLVIDGFGGIAYEKSQQPVDSKTLSNSFSISKGIVSTCIHILSDRGLIDYDDPIAHF